MNNGVIQTVFCSLVVMGNAAMCNSLLGQSTKGAALSKTNETADSKHSDYPPANVLSPDEWRRVDLAMDRALTFLAGEQEPDGSFPTLLQGQPAVTSLCVLAFMAQGHSPDGGPYGQRLADATDYIMSCQKQNGVIAFLMPDGPKISRQIPYGLGGPAAYDHAISSLTLAEVYGMQGFARTEKIRRVIEKALAATLLMQRWKKRLPHDQGGWRYISDDNVTDDSDLSVTGWELMFLRSARNAGFDVPKEAIDDAVVYVRRTFMRESGTFIYNIEQDRGVGPGSRAMAGAGILALAHAGAHNSFEAQSSAKWFSSFNFDKYNHDGGLPRDRYHYSLFHCCQGMYQLGGKSWEQFYPRMTRAVLANQQPDGSWEAERQQGDQVYGNSYSTALVVLSLAAPNDTLPIFQR